MKIENLTKIHQIGVTLPELLKASYAITIYDSEIKFQGKFSGNLVKSLLNLGYFQIDQQTGYVEGVLTTGDFQISVTLTE